MIGAVGCGKTSLLMAILGEMPIQEGTMFCDTSTEVVLAEQEPLIVTGTVEFNITFGLFKDDAWYKNVC